MKESEVKELLEKHGWTLLGVKRFKTHDRITVQTPSGKLTLRLILKKHLEDFTLEHAIRWFNLKENKQNEEVRA